jgi:hypothetical protein
MKDEDFSNLGTMERVYFHGGHGYGSFFVPLYWDPHLSSLIAFFSVLI